MSCSSKTVILQIIMAELGCSAISDLEEMVRTSMTGKAKDRIEALIDTCKREQILHEQGQEYPTDSKRKFRIPLRLGNIYNFDPQDMVNRGFFIDPEDFDETDEGWSDETDEGTGETGYNLMVGLANALPFEADLEEVGVSTIRVRAKSLDTLKNLINSQGRVVINFMDITDSLKRTDW